ncbi:MAG: LysE family translocator [Spirochaetia bacterium]|nr:LysE family translocator [Spirochaetia bacterium]
MFTPIQMLLSGSLLGLTLGSSPSPVMTLTISKTIRYGAIEGIKIACAPLITDFPIAVISILIFSRLPNREQYLGVIFILGALFIARLGIRGIRTKGLDIDPGKENPDSFKQGVITNFLNPNVYVFWFTIGSVAVVESWSKNPLSSILYLVGFYALLIGTRVVLTLFIAKSKLFDHPKAYLLAMRLLGIVLIGFAGYYGYQGIVSFI